MRWQALALSVALGGCGRFYFELQPLADATPPECTDLRIADAPYANSSEGADGTLAGTPFLLCTAEQLAAIAQHPENWASAFRLAADLQLTGAFTPIATSTNRFTGAFDGGGHTIAGLTIDQPLASDVGMFADLGAGASIHDLTLANVDVTASDSVGALAGDALGATFDHITLTGMVTGSGNSIGGIVGSADADTPTDIPMTLSNIDVTITMMGGGNLGGVAGVFSSGAKNSTITNVTVNGLFNTASYVGGVVGTYNGVIDNAHTNVDIHCSEDCGGIVGSSFLTAEIHNSSAIGDVNCLYVVCGGLAADDTSLISHSFATGNVTCGDGECAGLAAAPQGPIEYSYATGNVTGVDLVGGLAAVQADAHDIHDCYATGIVIGRDQIGGLIGAGTGGSTISRSYATGSVSGRDQVGGFIGYMTSSAAPTTLADSFATGNVSGMSATNYVSTMLAYAPGTVTLSGLYTLASATCTNTSGMCTTNSTPSSGVATLQSASNAPLSAWDFTNVWQEVPNGFPVLR